MLTKTSDTWSKGTLSSRMQRTTQSRAIKSWEIVSVDQPISVRLGTGKTLKVSCTWLIDLHTLTPAQLKEQGLFWVPRMFKRAEGGTCYFCILTIAPCKIRRWCRSYAADPRGRTSWKLRVNISTGRIPTHHSIVPPQASGAGLVRAPSSPRSPDDAKAEKNIRSEVSLGNPNDNLGTIEDWPRHRLTNNRGQNAAPGPMGKGCRVEPGEPDWGH